ncbi:MAG: ABC transporter permease [Candidatus Carbobacillus altaicus]|nr:ABC transporter permease [Candidatus Carbobacillus altaicus]
MRLWDRFLHSLISPGLWVPFGSIVLGFLVGAIIMAFGGFNPFVAYAALMQKAFGSPYNIGEMLREMTPLLLTGLSVAFAFRAGLLNIGTAGQMVMGSLGAALVGVLVPLPPIVHAIVALFVGVLFGALWGSLVGYLKAYRGVNEVIAAIMLNWVALYFANYVIRTAILDPQQKQRSLYVASSARINADFLSALFQNARLSYGFLLALLMVYVFWFLLYRTRLGFELRAVGAGAEAAQYAGIRIGRQVIVTMFLSGAFSGLAGAIEVLGVYGYMTISTVHASYGFDGIAVALLGGATALGTLFSAFLFAVLSYGAAGMQFAADVPLEVSRVVMAAILFFVAASALVRSLYTVTLGRMRRGSLESEVNRS